MSPAFVESPTGHAPYLQLSCQSLPLPSHLEPFPANRGLGPALFYILKPPSIQVSEFGQRRKWWTTPELQDPRLYLLALLFFCVAV